MAVGATFDRVDALFDRRFGSQPSWVTLGELFLGMGWARAAVEKQFAGDWWSGNVIVEFVAANESQTVRWYQPILDTFVLDYAWAWAACILALELLISASLLLHREVGAGLAAGIFLNVNFVLTGAPNPSVFYLVIQLALALWLFEVVAAPKTSVSMLRVTTIAASILALSCMPLVATLDPHAVIEDPAAVLASWGLCTAVAASAARRRVRRTKILSSPGSRPRRSAAMWSEEIAPSRARHAHMTSKSCTRVRT